MSPHPSDLPALLRTIALVLIALHLSGCADCQRGPIEQLDERLRIDTTRTGKVGTYLGLQVASNARQASRQIALRTDGPCQIGWALDQAFELQHEIEITVRHGRYERSFHEEGRLQRSHDEEWYFQAEQALKDGELQTHRTVRLLNTTDALITWEGAEVASFLPEREAQARRRLHEIASRFGALMTLISPGWERHHDGSYRPGESSFFCGPIMDPDARHWRPLFAARSELENARVLSEGPCRTLQAEFRLPPRGSMSLRLQECLQDDPAYSPPPLPERMIDLSRHSDRLAITQMIDTLINAELVAPADSPSTTSERK